MYISYMFLTNYSRIIRQEYSVFIIYSLLLFILLVLVETVNLYFGICVLLLVWSLQKETLVL